MTANQRDPNAEGHEKCATASPSNSGLQPEILPYWRLSGFYLFYFASLGALIPYWGLYLKSLGFGPEAIGGLMAVLLATKVVAPNVWGWMADRRGQRLGIVRTAALFSALAFAGVYLNSAFWWLAAVMAVFSFFWNAALPQFEVITLNHLGEHVHRYTRIRLWGSIGFILAVLLLGRLLDVYDVAVVPHWVLAFMAGIWVAAVLVRERPREASRREHQPLRRVLRHRRVLALLAACFLMQATHGPFYAFYSIYLEGHGYSRGLIGQLWALGVVAEVVLFVFMHRLVERFSLRNLFLSSFVLTGLRWVLVALFPESLAIQAFAQLLHAASFGVYHAVAILLIHRFFVGPHQGRGQALYSSMSFGAGGGVGTFASGFLWVSAGSQTTYLVAAAVSVLGLIVAWRWIDTDTDNQDPGYETTTGQPAIQHGARTRRV